MSTQERILNKVIDLFFSRGIKSITMDDIAIANGISKRTLYEHFTNKADLVEACISYFISLLDKRMIDIEKESSNVIDFILKLSKLNSESLVKCKYTFFLELKKFYPAIYEKTITGIRDRNLNTTISLLKRGQKEETILREINPELVGAIICNSMDALANQDFMSNTEFSKQEHFIAFMSLFCRGLTTDKGRLILDEIITEKNKI